MDNYYNDKYNINGIISNHDFENLFFQELNKSMNRINNFSIKNSKELIRKNDFIYQ
jgi:hypothetical protein